MHFFFCFIKVSFCPVANSGKNDGLVELLSVCWRVLGLTVFSDLNLSPFGPAQALALAFLSHILVPPFVLFLFRANAVCLPFRLWIRAR